jgi:hypothetical protein
VKAVGCGDRKQDDQGEGGMGESAAAARQQGPCEQREQKQLSAGAANG